MVRARHDDEGGRCEDVMIYICVPLEGCVQSIRVVLHRPLEARSQVHVNAALDAVNGKARRGHPVREVSFFSAVLVHNFIEGHALGN